MIAAFYGRPCHALPPNISIVALPDVRTIVLNSALQEITLSLRTNSDNVDIFWSLDGPGSLEGDLSSRKVSYLLPAELAAESAEAHIAARVLDDLGNDVRQEIVFRLYAPLTASAPISAEKQAEIERILAEADDYFRKTFFLEPEGKNAFALYKRVLTLDAANLHAREHIGEIAAKYKKWGNLAYDDRDREKSLKFYQRYLSIAEHIVYILDDRSIALDMLEVQKRLLELQEESLAVSSLGPETTPTAVPTSTPTQLPEALASPSQTPVPTPTPTLTPAPNSTPTPTPEPRSLKLLRTADAYFERKRFTTPADGNAFDLYQEVLTLDPANAHARERLYAIAETYNNWGAIAYENEDYQKAKNYYERFLKVAEYLQESFDDPLISKDVSTARIRLLAVEHQLSQPIVIKSAVEISESSEPDILASPSPSSQSPSPSPTPSPSPKPTRQAGVEKLLLRGDRYFRQERFFEPEEANAYTMYQQVLELDPMNRYARKQMLAIADISYALMQEASRAGDEVLTKTYYKQHKAIIEDLLQHALRPQLADAFQGYVTFQQNPDSFEIADITAMLERIIDILEDILHIHDIFPDRDLTQEKIKIKAEIERFQKELLQYQQ